MGIRTMDRREFLKTAAAGAGALALGCRGRVRARRPNFVFILADDLGWRDTGFMGSRYYETPNLDRLASEGMVFTNAYANAPNCAPTRASLLTGRYTPRHGIYTVNNPDRGPARLRKLIPIPNRTILPAEEVTLAEALKPAGYRCASIGKWHLGQDPGSGPLSQGFDLNVGDNRRGHPRSYFSPYHNPNLPDGPPGEYLTDRLTDEAIRFLRQNRGVPFFLYLAYYAVHTPLHPKPDLLAKYRGKPPSDGQSNPAYAAMIESLDTNVGRLLEELDRLGLRKNTVVIFFSDNGGVVGITSNAPLRGGKGMLYEGGIRVPCVIRWPGVTRGGQRCEVPVIGIDFFPTILEIAGVSPPPGVVLDGVSLASLLRGDEGLEREAICWHFPAYLEGRAEGARDPYFRTRPAGAVRTGEWKLIEYFEDGALELYNLAEDVGEKRNLADQLPDKTEELLEMLRAWRRGVGAPVPTEPNPEYRPEA